MTAITQPGVYFDLDADVYHSDPTPNGSLSSTWARRLMEPAGPAKFAHERRHGQPYKKVYDFGTVAHSIVLGGPAPAIYPEDTLSKTGTIGTDKARAFAAAARAQGLIPMKQTDFDTVMGMAEAIKQHREAMAILADAEVRTEVSGFRVDPETGMWLRCRFDAIGPAGIVDYKTTVDADPGLFARRTAHELGYHQQAAWYLDAAQALDLTDGPFRFVLQEKKAPYLVSVVELDPMYLSIGRSRNRAAIDLYAKCLATDTWPGFTGVSVAEPPMWLADSEPSTLPDDLAAQLAAYADQLAKETVS